jgi:NAD(P)H-nitrite reductase large subunit
MGVTAGEIIDAINSGAGTIEEIQEATGAGTVCGGCISDIEELLKNRE